MRWGVLVAALGLAGGAASCASRSADDDGVTGGEDDVTGLSNSMGLRLEYDETTHHVHATVRQKLREGETLKLRVRRGRLTMDSESELDCSQLPDAPELPLADGATRCVYDGPEVDPSLLASVYDESWVMGNVTPQMLDVLEREGADSIVEACIVNGDVVRARLQTSLQYAWDQADPNLAPQAVQRASFDPPSAGSARPIHSMERYAQLCVRELGEIPFFTKKGEGKYTTFDCRDFVESGGGPIDGVEGALVPESVSTASGADVTPATCDGRDVARSNCFSRCDRPAWSSRSCEPGPTVATAKNAQGTHWTLLCRSTIAHGAGDDPAALRATKRFDDIAMIGHDPKTGKTCFFQNKLFDGTDGARIPHPADLEKARHVWDAPKGYCVECHSGHPFIHTPWIDGAKRRDGTPIVPMMGKHPDFPLPGNASPYSVVNHEVQSWSMPKHLVSPQANACLECHRIGGGAGMRRLPMWAAGQEGLDASLGPMLSDGAKRIDDPHAMLLGPDASKYAAALTQIEACARDANAAGCVWQDVPAP